MFQLSLVDHLRLTFGGLVAAYEGHTDAAARLVRWSWYAKLGVLVLVGLSAAAGVAAVLRGGTFLIVAPSLGALAFVGCAALLAVEPDRRVYAHRSTAARLWLICEKFRALLAEIHDQLVDMPAVVQRRDALLREVSELFGQAAPGDRATYEIAKTTLSGTLGRGYSDQEIDHLLPASLRRATGTSS